MESSQTIKEIISSSNQNVKRIYFILIISFLSISACAIIYFYYSFVKSDTNYQIIILDIFAFPLGTALFVFLLSHISFRNFIFFRLIVLFDAKRRRYHTNLYFVLVLFRVLFSFGLCLFTMNIGIILLYNITGIQVPGKSFGFIAVYYSIVFFFIYGIIALPRMISFKTNKNENIYIYWFQYIKSMMVNSPISMYFSFVLFVLISAIIVFFTKTRTGTQQNPIWFSISSLSETNMYGIVVSILGIWLATILIIINDFLKNFIRLYKCYEEYTTHVLRQRIIEAKYVHYIVIGIGNLGRIVGGHLAVETLRQQKNKFPKVPLALFECFIDRDFEIRVIPRSIIFIEKNISLFEETRLDSESGLTYGFINGSDLNYENAGYHTLPPELAIFCINGDGGYLPILELADFSTSHIIINTSSDPDLGFKLKILVNNQIASKLKPIIITTVEDSGTYSFLEGNSHVTIFPLHAGMIEGNSIATRLFAIIMKAMDGIKIEESKIRLFFAGSGKTVYYSLYLLLNIMQEFFKSSELKTFIEKNLIIITNDQEILSESVIQVDSNDYPNRHLWITKLVNNENYRIKMIYHDPSGFHGFNNAYLWAQNEICNSKNTFNEYDLINLIASKGSHDAIRICQHIRNVSESYSIEKACIIASITLDIYPQIKEQLEKFDQLKKFLSKNSWFPCEIKDVILKKNLIIGSQIISISECFRDKYYFDNSKASYSLPKTGEKDGITGELAFCMNDSPLTFSKILTRFAGLSEPILSKNRDYVPSFYNNYTYTLNSTINGLNNVYIFRGDASLKNISGSEPQPLIIDNFTLNGSSHFIKEAGTFVSNVFNGAIQHQKSCKYNTRCPVSNNCHNENHKSLTYNAGVDDAFATIKILADFEDVTGSFAIMLCDFLMFGYNLYYENDKTIYPNLDIIYENCIKCENRERAVARFYINFNMLVQQTLKDDMSEETKAVLSGIEDKKSSLLARRNILGIKVKPIYDKHKHWNAYCIQLQKYLENVSIRKFKIIEDYNEITIYQDGLDIQAINFIQKNL